MPLAATILAACPIEARAQTGVSPEAAPAAPEVPSPQINPTGPQTETTPVDPPATVAPDAAAPDAATPDAAAPDAAMPDIATGATAAPARLTAASVAYEGAAIVATGTPDQPVKFQSAAGLIIAQQVRLDTQTQQLQASGTVQFERERRVTRKELRPQRLPANSRVETVRETAFGNNLNYDFKTGQGTLDGAKLRLATISIATESLTINGKSYVARNVLLRPGGLTDEEIKIYGTPPFNLRAREITATPVVRNGQERQRITVRGGGLYFGKTRILPVPSYSFYAGGPRNQNSNRITPASRSTPPTVCW